MPEIIAKRTPKENKDTSVRKMSEKQKSFIKVLQSRKYLYLMCGGSIASGKSFGTIGILDELCQQYPGVRFAVVRKSLTTLRRNTIPTFNKILETYGKSNRARLNKSEWTARYRNGSEILFLEADVSTDPDLNKLKGLEVTGWLMEEANECDRSVVTLLNTRWGRWKNKDYNIPPFGLFTTNPDKNWVKTEFYDNWAINKLVAPHYFLQMLPQDNPWNTPEFLHSLTFLPKAEHERYVLGNWDFSDDPNQLISYLWYKDCLDLDPNPDRIPCYLGIDVAREGDDGTELCFGDDEGIIKFKSYRHMKANNLAPLVAHEIQANGIRQENIIVDGIGVGSGLIDCLEMLGIYVETFKGSEGTTMEIPHYMLRNKRAEAHWCYRLDMENQRITVPVDEDLQRETMNLKYFTTDRYIQIEDKAQIKKRLKKSPDKVEAAIMMNWLRRKNTGGFDFYKNIGSRTEVSTLANKLMTSTHSSLARSMYETTEDRGIMSLDNYYY